MRQYENRVTSQLMGHFEGLPQPSFLAKKFFGWVTPGAGNPGFPVFGPQNGPKWFFGPRGHNFEIFFSNFCEDLLVSQGC